MTSIAWYSDQVRKVKSKSNKKETEEVAPKSLITNRLFNCALSCLVWLFWRSLVETWRLLILDKSSQIVACVRDVFPKNLVELSELSSLSQKIKKIESLFWQKLILRSSNGAKLSSFDSRYSIFFDCNIRSSRTDSSYR